MRGCLCRRLFYAGALIVNCISYCLCSVQTEKLQENPAQAIVKPTLRAFVHRECLFFVSKESEWSSWNLAFKAQKAKVRFFFQKHIFMYFYLWPIYRTVIVIARTSNSYFSLIKLFFSYPLSCMCWFLLISQDFAVQFGWSSARLHRPF